MAVSLQDLLKPAKFEAEPDSPEAAKQLKHWLKVFISFLERCERFNQAGEAEAEPNQIQRLQALFAYISPDVCEYVEDVPHMMLPQQH